MVRAPSRRTGGLAMNLFRRIPVPHDFSAHADRALDLAARLAKEHGARLLVLHVITPLHPLTALPEAGVPLLPETDLLALAAPRLEGRGAHATPRPHAPCGILHPLERPERADVRRHDVLNRFPPGCSNTDGNASRRSRSAAAP